MRSFAVGNPEASGGSGGEVAEPGEAVEEDKEFILKKAVGHEMHEKHEIVDAV
ncbi:hypothetical protein [Rhodocyclus purpureus]|uniref:hypothetical protein n=1 Tax=Rhodocyclus purpureus TaxID=1067 RepID=UPI0019121CD3|nr:hypothetical protein [Rhodocyclus purpureus]